MRAGHRAFVRILPWLLALLLVPGALAQNEPVLVDRTDEGVLQADQDAPAAAVFELFNLNPRDDFYVRVNVPVDSDWRSDVAVEGARDAGGFFLAPRESVNVTVSFEPLRDTHPREFQVEFQFVHGDTGVVTRVTQDLVVESLVPPHVLGLFENPLPAPLDNVYGTFLLEMAFWLALALVALLAEETIVRMLTTRASNKLTREILQKLRKPVFLFILFLGLARSFAILPPTPVTGFVARTLIAIAMGVFGLYVVFRIVDSVLLYYQQVIAPRTSSRVDDIVVSLLRKFGIAILWVVGFVYVLRTLGWDPTLVFAGAGIAGLVIAFAAQDTFSNLFSGVFLLLDRPFVEGDDIQLETGEIVRVDSIGLRTTRLYHPRHHESIVLPNNHLATRRVTNLAGPDGRYWIMIDIGVSYSSDVRHVTRVLEGLVHGHPKLIMDDPEWEPRIIFSAFGESSLNFIVRCAVRDFRERFLVASELRYAIFEAFEREGIEIPFPQRTVWLHNVDQAQAATGALD